jgi:hypothetical protein
MTRSTSWALVLFLVIILITSSGCIMSQGLTNNTSSRIGTMDIVPATSSAPVTANYTIPFPAGRPSVNVLRGEPFVINGTVDNLSITKVQIWLLNGTISTAIIPIMPDGRFRIVLDSPWTATLSRNFSPAIVVQYPAPPDLFSVVLNTTSGTVIETKTGKTTTVLSHVNDRDTYPTTQADYLEQGISATGNADAIIFLNGVDAWITIDPLNQSQPGSLEVSGTTSLPTGTSLSILVETISTHPTPKNYDSSHEFASGNATVFSTAGGVNRFDGIVNTTLLNTGKYRVYIESQGNLQANAQGDVEIIAKPPVSPEKGNYIDRARLGLPTLMVNETLSPVMLDGEWQIVPPGTQTSNNKVPYGSIIDCTPDGICRVFNKTGVQFLAVYNSNEARIMEVPNGAMIGQGPVGNVTIIKLDDNVILTKIDEYSPGS